MQPDPTKISNNPYPVNPVGLLIGSFFGVSAKQCLLTASHQTPVADSRLGLVGQAILYGVHASQVYRYFSTFSRDSIRYKLLVAWIFLLGTLQVLILVVSSWKYYVDGIWNPKVWGTFWWPLSFQDGIVSTRAGKEGVANVLTSEISFADTSHGFHCSVVLRSTCVGIVGTQEVVRNLDGGPPSRHPAGGVCVSSGLHRGFLQ
jgi:hypothetical protein